jgi:hypothetical protein
MVRAMNRYVAAAVMWGTALGLVAYRYGMLPFDWASPWKHVLPGVAVGLVVGGSQLVRMNESDDVKRPVMVMLALGVVGAALAFGLANLAFPTLAHADLTKRELPGFSLSLPSGGDVIENRSEYNVGKLGIKNVGNSHAAAFVQWDLGGGLEKNELELVAGVMGKALGVAGKGRIATIPGPDGKPVDTIVFGGDPTFAMGMLPCGVRQVAIALAGPAEVTELLPRVVATFSCHPDPAQESTAAVRFPLVLELPAGWYVGSREVDQIMITDGLESGLLLRASPARMPVDLDVLVEPMFKVMGVQGKITKREPNRVWITMNDGSDSIDGWFRLVTCPDATAMVMAVAADPATLNDLDARVTRARCLRPGEKSQEWPDPPPGAPTMMP